MIGSNLIRNSDQLGCIFDVDISRQVLWIVYELDEASVAIIDINYNDRTLIWLQGDVKSVKRLIQSGLIERYALLDISLCLFILYSIND